MLSVAEPLLLPVVVTDPVLLAERDELCVPEVDADALGSTEPVGEPELEPDEDADADRLPLALTVTLVLALGDTERLPEGEPDDDLDALNERESLRLPDTDQDSEGEPDWLGLTLVLGEPEVLRLTVTEVE